ncbi:MAG: TIGR00296 family protein [Deltaproteobacteria bacterium]|nr:MAG: TIGR00296 family protein [Deltaproteobacteria bacterium]
MMPEPVQRCRGLPVMRPMAKRRWPVIIGIVWLGLFISFPRTVWCAEHVRRAVWAGQFYPAAATDLTGQIEALVAQVRPSSLPQRPAGRLRALVMPHAGYGFSGLTAAHAVPLMRGKRWAKVVILGPDHRVGLRNGAVSDADAWKTPLGSVRLHPDARSLRRSGLFRAVEASDRREHAIEVLLPFFQYALQDFQVVPVVMGPGDLAGMTREIGTIVDGDTLLVVSSDLSHGLPPSKARDYDRRTLDLILALDGPGLLARENSACGKIPLAVLATLARQRHWQPVLVHYSNSGDAPQGSSDWIVGYATVAFFGDDPMNETASSFQLTEAQGQLLVRLARQTIARRLGRAAGEGDLAAQAAKEPAFQRRSGTFVTLKIDGRLRGCIGSLAAEETICQGVQRNALNAAFNDYRFAPLTAEELDQVAIEVSILTPPAPLDYRDADDLVARLRPGVDGVILRQGSRSATFLPQVWEQLPRAEAFLDHLCLKAGLSPEAWRRGEVQVSTYQVVYFEEPSDSHSSS